MTILLQCNNIYINKLSSYKLPKWKLKHLSVHFQKGGKFYKGKVNKIEGKGKLKRKYPGKAPLDPKVLQQYSRGEGISNIGVKHPLYAAKLKKKEKKINYAQEQAARAEILLTENQG